MYDTSLSKETTNKNPGQKWIFKSEVKVHEIYPSSLNHGSVKNGCISNRIVTIVTFLISRHFPLNHDYGRIRVDCKVTLIFTGGVSPPVHPRSFLWCEKVKLGSLSSEIFVEIGGPSYLKYRYEAKIIHTIKVHSSNLRNRSWKSWFPSLVHLLVQHLFFQVSCSTSRGYLELGWPQKGEPEGILFEDTKIWRDFSRLKVLRICIQWRCRVNSIFQRYLVGGWTTHLKKY